MSVFLAVLLLLLVVPLGTAAEPPAAGDRARAAASDLGLVIDPSKPLHIKAQEFEAARGQAGGDVITFSRSVVATQEDMTLVCDWLEAEYPAGGGTPKRITARGSVRVTQPGTEITCGELVYDNPACRVTCTGTSGPAVVVRGGDVMRGREIEMDLCRNRLKVRGGAAIELHPGPDADVAGEPGE